MKFVCVGALDSVACCMCAVRSMLNVCVLHIEEFAAVTEFAARFSIKLFLHPVCCHFAWVMGTTVLLHA